MVGLLTTTAYGSIAPRYARIGSGTPLLTNERRSIPLSRFIPVAFLRPPVVSVLFMIVLTTILVAMLPRPLSADVSGQLWMADRLRHGAELYSGISEINPPLWFWLAIPVDKVAELFRTSAEGILIAAVGTAATASLLATSTMLPRWPAEVRTILLIYCGAIFLIMPLRDLGQREQFVLIATLPYAALLANRRERKQVPAWLALLVGSGAAIGFALKHYFVGVPLLLECWLAFGLRRSWRPVRPETVALAVAAVAYIAAIIVITPGFLSISVPESALAYSAVGAPNLAYMIRPAQPVWVLIVYVVATRRIGLRRNMPPLVGALLVAALGFFLAWLVQRKGWPYQSVATTGALALATAAFVIEELVQRASRPRLIVVAALAAPLLLALAPTQWTPDPDSDIAPALVDLRPGDTVAILSVEGRTEWPSTVNRGFVFSGRRGSLWMLAAIDANSKHGHDPRVDGFGRRVISETLVDFRCTPPLRIIFSPGHVARAGADAGEDPSSFFQRDPRFVRLLAHYRRLDRKGGFDAYTLIRPLDPLPASQCQGRT